MPHCSQIYTTMAKEGGEHARPANLRMNSAGELRGRRLLLGHAYGCAAKAPYCITRVSNANNPLKIAVLPIYNLYTSNFREFVRHHSVIRDSSVSGVWLSLPGLISRSLVKVAGIGHLFLRDTLTRQVYAKYAWLSNSDPEVWILLKNCCLKCSCNLEELAEIAKNLHV